MVVGRVDKSASSPDSDRLLIVGCDHNILQPLQRSPHSRWSSYQPPSYFLNPTAVRMKELGYNTISVVLETWDKARFNSKNFDDEFGMVVLMKMFELHPRSKSVFGYDKGEEEGRKSAEVHAKAFAGLLDSVVQMLGPDIEFIEEILQQVGKRHKTMGISPSFFPYLGQALTHALDKYLGPGNQLTDDQKDAWDEVFDEISNEMVKSILN